MNDSPAYLAAMATRRSPFRQLIAKHLEDPAGFTTAELIELHQLDQQGVYSLRAACHAMRFRDAVQTIWASKTGRRTVRLFGRPEWADAHQAVTPQRVWVGSREVGVARDIAEWHAPRRGAPFRPKGRATWDRSLPPVITPDTKFTFAPPPPARVLRSNTHSHWG